MARPIIALLTDFGVQDHYVAAMKGVMLGISPDASFVDITHDIAPQDVLGAALELQAVHAYLPAGTVFLVVVDPGVGTTRRALAARTDRYGFVGPDNGVLWPSLSVGAALVCVDLIESRYQRATVSKTFEGRDRFAPAAAWLAAGTPLDQFGPPVSPMWLDVPRAQVREGTVVGEVVRVDRFGNLITNIDRGLLDSVASPRVVHVNGRLIAGVVETFADVPLASPCAFVGSSDRLEIGINGDSARARFLAGRGTRVRVSSAA